jgi:cadmium resistance protein CadD (predicted permease)
MAEMGEILIIVGVTSAAFIGTNLDNLLLLTAMYSRYERQALMVTAGYFTGMALVGGIAVIIGEAGDYIPLAYLGLLGVIPITMGVVSLWKLFRNKGNMEDAGPVVDSKGLTVFLALITTQLSNSADSIIAFSALLAESTDRSDFLITPTYLAMIGIFSGVAYYSLRHKKLSEFLERYGQYVTPFILILVGLYIFSNTSSDLVPG